MKWFYLIHVMLMINSCSEKSFNIYQFEKSIPSNIEIDNSIITLCDQISRDGKYSLKWEYNSNSTLNIIGDIGFTPFISNNTNQNRDHFIMWIYNPISNTNYLKIEFFKDNQLKTYFTFNLDFQGWRTAWVKYEGDMKGKPEQGINKITIISPSNSGIIYLDQIIPTASIDPRFSTRDMQVPFINKEADNGPNAHWVARYFQYNFYQNSIENIRNIKGSSYIQDINKIKDRYITMIFSSIKVNKEIINNLESLYKEYLLKNVDYKYRLRSFSGLSSKEKEIATNYIQLSSIGKLMFSIARAYNSTKNLKYKIILSKMYIDLFTHLKESGWDIGSGQGTLSHLGYNTRELGKSFLLMEYVLEENNLSQLTSDWLAWFNGLGIIFTSLQEIKGTNVDILNTLLENMVIAALIHPNIKIKTYILAGIKKYLDYGILNSPGLAGGFKDDGSGFHHHQHYPAYTQDGFKGLAPLIYGFSKTQFALSPQAHEKTKNTLLMLRASANTHDFLLSISGRHPNNKVKLSPKPYYYYGLAGSPDRNQYIDKEMMEAYLRLDSKSSKSKELLKLGYSPESSPKGTWTMNMASLQLHRQKDWLVAMRGFSRYLVGNESYIANNLYGRYMSYGNFQFLQGNAEKSGFVQEGFDWNHISGITAISLPFDKLSAKIRQVDLYSGIEEMLLSDRVFSGGNSLDDIGIFAMKLHENPKYNGSHHAKKSAFFFNDTVVFLGTDITNNDIIHETHTTIFQNYLGNKSASIVYTNLDHNLYIKDSIGNLYYIPQSYSKDLIYKAGLQYSRHQAKDIKTENNFELVYLNHGKAPINKSYEYVMLIQGSDKRIKEFLQDQKYEILHKDSKAHIIKTQNPESYFYVFFEPKIIMNNTYIREVDIASTIIIKPTNQSLKLSFVNPDLSLYRGIDKSQYDENNNMKEVSIYSRPWRFNQSIPNTNNIILHGIWKLNTTNSNVNLSYLNSVDTKIQVITSYGTPISMILTPE